MIRYTISPTPRDRALAARLFSSLKYRYPHFLPELIYRSSLSSSFILHSLISHRPVAEGTVSLLGLRITNTYPPLTKDELLAL